MRAVVQRVSEAQVSVAGETIGEIGQGLCALVGVTHDDEGSVLVVSQFTLYGDARKGRRPSYVDAARPEHAEPLVERVVAELRDAGVNVETGRFRADMLVSLVNQGPVTIIIEV